MSREWVNIFPLLKDKRIAEDKVIEVMSAWIPTHRIRSIDLIRSKENGIYWIRLDLDTDQAREGFDSLTEALKAWKAIEGALGIRNSRKKGPKRIFFEQLTHGAV